MNANKVIVLSGGAGNVVAPCLCEGVDIISKTATFNFQYTDASNTNAPNGDAAAALQYTATMFVFRAEAPRNQPWQPGTQIGVIAGGGATDSISVVPRRVS